MKREKATADELFRQIIRERDGMRCVRCGRRSHLEVAHIVPRRFSWTRTWEPNAVLLCSFGGCHDYFTRHPAQFTAWVMSFLGESVYDALQERSQRTDRFDWGGEVVRLRAVLRTGAAA